jgi:DNA-binding YbaB/EbfC family protein
MFGNLAEMAGLMKKVTEMQKSVKKMQEEMSSLELSGKSAGGQVEAVIGGDMLIRRVCVSPELLKTGDSAAVGDAVKEAVNAALVLMKAEAAKRLSVATGGLSNSFPGLF